EKRDRGDGPPRVGPGAPRRPGRHQEGAGQAGAAAGERRAGPDLHAGAPGRRPLPAPGARRGPARPAGGGPAAADEKARMRGTAFERAERTHTSPKRKRGNGLPSLALRARIRRGGRGMNSLFLGAAVLAGSVVAQPGKCGEPPGVPPQVVVAQLDENRRPVLHRMEQVMEVKTRTEQVEVNGQVQQRQLNVLV